MRGGVVTFLVVVVGLAAVVRPARTPSAWQDLSSTRGEIEAPGPSTQQTAALVADLDRDGVNDFVIASRGAGPSVLWYRRVPTGWLKYLVDADTLPIEAGGAAFDVDGDGDLDLIFGGDGSSDRIWWWENPSPRFDQRKPWVRREIKISGENKHHDQLVGDFDGDGKPELITWNQGARSLLRFVPPPKVRQIRSWPAETIYTWGSGEEHEGLAKADVDADGQEDIIGGGRWFRHIGNGKFAPEVIDDSQRFTRAAAGQLKKGGWAEVVFVAGDRPGRIKWYEWSGKEWLSHDLLGFDVNHGHSLAVGDIDGDGNLDIFCAEMAKWTTKAAQPDNPNPRMWIFFGDGRGKFETVEFQRGIENHDSKLADLNGDGLLDILDKTYNWNAPRLDVFLNPGKLGRAKAPKR